MQQVTELPSSWPITVLNCNKPVLRKTFSIDENRAPVSNRIQMPKEFGVKINSFNGIMQLGELISDYSRLGNITLIRGVNLSLGNHFSVRTKENFPEPTEGIRWVMLDFDNVTCPDGVIPFSQEAIRYLISTLPTEFHDVTCFYQHSASAGIVGVNGQLRKKGINAHIFFCFSQPIQGRLLSAFLKQHAMDSNQCKIQVNSAGQPSWDFGFDPSVIVSSVQPHYIASPVLCEGVNCMLKTDERQAFLPGTDTEVRLPVLAADLIFKVKSTCDHWMTKWKIENGFKRDTSMIQTRGGLSTTTIWRKPGQGMRLEQGRDFIGGELSANGDFFTLMFSDESSRGSWYVAKHTPQIARHHGGECMELETLSPAAYKHVRNELKWFNEISKQTMALVNHRLPPLTFAESRHALIEAPTGCGKTTQAKAYIRSLEHAVIYSAPTIALCRQALADFSAVDGGRKLQVVFYQDVSHEAMLNNADVVVTTNASLPRILDHFLWESMKFSLIVDEVHIALDEFMRVNANQETLRLAVTRAEQVLYLTGTITPIQTQMLAQIAYNITGRIGLDVFCHYKFNSERKYPLELWDRGCFESEFVAALQELQAFKLEGKPLPRMVLILPTSKMRKYEELLTNMDLHELAYVVSRPESMNEEIEAARTSELPILISSSLFSTGLNFARDADVFWCYFEHYQVDSSAIIQTLNRANRNPEKGPCDVRLYVGNVDRNEIVYPSKDHELCKIRGFIDDLDGGLTGIDVPRLLDRLVYNEMRIVEKNTRKALGRMIAEDSFQNYTLLSEDPKMKVIKRKKRYLWMLRKWQKLIMKMKLKSCWSFLVAIWDSSFLKLERLADGRNRNLWAAKNKTDRAFQYESKAIVAGLIGAESNLYANPASVEQLKVLFTEKESFMPFLSKNMVLKVDCLIKNTQAIEALVDCIEGMKLGRTNAVIFAKNLNRNKSIQTAFLALSSSEAAWIRLKSDFEFLGSLGKKRKSSNTKGTSGEFQEFSLGLTKDLLGKIGISFPVENIKGVGKRTNYEKAIIPPWDFAAMKRRFNEYICMLKALPNDCRIISHEMVSHEGVDSYDVAKCCNCKLFLRGACVLGRAVNWVSWGFDDESRIFHMKSKCEYMQERRNNIRADAEVMAG